MHSSQMQTDGPVISFLTMHPFFPQKEQHSSSMFLVFIPTP
jgi:hypothetical protein